ncbi:Na/Pi cotransporter family protein [Phaeobacter gallaeciensis]|uniref:Na/Pi cotransporter family protein n=1 Tax=Phaeobacter gallaeciensis TaxID=60890 RepID=UPI0023805B0E|nr:Na/Pi cotransporter family protein [Phaeobacter gallaeciensis]MDE4275762.1 Na/Pi cotransporter family protein [Phaeobacter gallaeciensis]MDE4301025.1 Na/Pi cotransporter family protein [Phaeobacter gallaeciensis]MDE5186189.1 Na/Pi cotransporter family protein [Phaeobacter gallaeciensis]MEC9312266.1 Na/Pi cotransporter family protein [Pseudomonadota bacterium]
MAILTFLISLAGATMLLLFAVRMVRTGIERSYGASFQRLLTGADSQVQAGLSGIGLALVLQSSAAVALLVTGFAASGYLAFPAGLAIVLGGDLGSALIIQILSFRLDWLVPVLLAIGGYLFVKTEAKKPRQLGRILLGVAFILISLRFLREAMDPIRDSAFLPAIAGYLARDYITAFLVGGALAFVMHSSVAAILMCVTLVQIGALPFAAGLSLVLGANFGSAFIPIWLSRGMAIKARRIPFANLGLRGSWAVICLVAANEALREGLLGDLQGGQTLVYAHLAFNASLLCVALPLCRPMQGLMIRLLPEPAAPEDVVPGRPVSALVPGDYASPAQAVADLKRELLRMSGLIEAMFRPLPELYRSGDAAQIKAVQALDHEVNACLSGIRSYVAGIPEDSFDRAELKTAREMVEYAIRLETAGDVAAARLAALAGDLNRKGLRFSSDGWSEITRMHEAIMANLRLASNVLISDDLESARLLNLEKTEVKRMERDSRKRHLKRLQRGVADSFESSDIHLETLRALREFNSHIAAVSYPVLYRNGQLLETRLIEDMTPEPAG